MSLTPKTPSEVLATNLKSFMDLRGGMTQEELADSMSALGFSWHRRTVNRVIRAEQQVRLNELFALAPILETTAVNLLSPRGPEDIMSFDQTYQLSSALEPIRQPEYEIVLNQNVRGSDKPDVGVVGLPTLNHPDSVPKWRRRMSEVQLRVAHAFAEAQEQFPDLDFETSSVKDVLTAIEKSSPKGDSGSVK